MSVENSSMFVLKMLLCFPPKSTIPISGNKGVETGDIRQNGRINYLNNLTNGVLWDWIFS